jgi:hypothetical protein
MNIKNEKNIGQLILMIGLIVFGTLSRYLLVGAGLQPFPNFEIIMVVTFLAVMLMRSSLALLVPLITMISSDILLGNQIFMGDQMNRIVLFTYSGFAIIALLNLITRDRFWKGLRQVRIKSIGLIAGVGIGFVLLYDLWTNMGWWYLMYPHDASSLILVYSAGIPFMMYHLLSGLVTFCAIGAPVIFYYANKKENVNTQPLKLNRLHKVPALLVVVSLIALSFTGTAMNIPQNSEVWIEKSNQTSVRIEFVSPEWKLSENLIAYKDDTAFSLLKRCAEKHGFTVESTYYAEYDATWIDSINTIASGTEGKYWQYYVNGQLPIISADKFIVKNGDVLVWSFEKLSM